MVQVPHWITHRGIKTEIIDDLTLKLSGPDISECEIAVIPMPAGPGYRVSVDFVSDEGRISKVHTETPFKSLDAAWQAGFDLFKRRIEE